MSELKRCPFCVGELELTDDDYYWHPFNGCFLDANHVTNNEKRIKAWNTRKPMQNIVKRLEEENTLLKEQRTEAIEYDDEQIIFAANNQIGAFDYSLRVIKEEGGINEI